MAGRALFRDESHKADLVARNALRQFDGLRAMAPQHFDRLAITPDIICELQRLAIVDIYDCAGRFREWPISISNTTHQPPPHGEVKGLVAEMCDYLNSVGDQPIHAASYAMWRLNWIHPFGGGNGRTSRALSYLVLCATLKMDLPGTVTIPDMIQRERQPYYLALDAADSAWSAGQIDLQVMEALLSELLLRQLNTAI